MASRLELHDFLKGFAENVYFQPPASMQMKYPAIRYSVSKIDNNFANDNIYTQSHSYELIVIDEDPDSEIVSSISKIPTCRFERSYAAENLNHTVFIITY